MTASLLSLYEREDFIAELKNIFGEHLLSTISSDYKKEVNLSQKFCIIIKISLILLDASVGTHQGAAWRRQAASV